MKEELQAAQMQSRLVGFLPHVQDEVEKELNVLVNKTLTALNAGTLTPELALYAWMEYRANLQMLKRFQTKLQLGEAAGSRIASSLDSQGI